MNFNIMFFASPKSPLGGADVLLDLLMLLNQYYVYKPWDSSLRETS